ncbi:DUF4194 domain-containing protein [Sinomonas mesophila]|uniref:DUF4194 domain-containing protein n=1 Tax=Sinomonas mesophila TaxID=1531955 RepID=UPI001FEC6614|nr:DUF4194 domain-containing protein [Sinomonas mesophila]
MTEMTPETADALSPATTTDTDGEPASAQLWDGDAGQLRDRSRRALVQLVKGPYLSSARHANLWSALLADEAPIRSRLADMYLDLVLDLEAEVAFVRNVAAVERPDVPKVLRTAPLTFLDTALLLHLRQQLLHDAGGSKTIVGHDEVADQLKVYQGRDKADPAGFAKRIDASWNKMVRYGLLASTSTEGRFEVSPVLRLVFGAEEIRAVQEEYRRLVGADEVEPLDGTDDGEEDA